MADPEKSKFGFDELEESKPSSTTNVETSAEKNSTEESSSEGADSNKSKFGFDDEFEQAKADSPVYGGLLGSALSGVFGLKDALTPSPENAQAISTDLEAAAEAAKTSGEKWAEKTGYGVGKGTVRDVSQKFQRMAPKGKMARAYAEKLGGTQAMRTAAAEAASAEAAAARAAAEEANKFVNLFGKPIGQFLETPIRRALSGFSTGFGALDAYNRYMQGDTTNATLAGTGALASLIQPAVRTGLARAGLGTLGYGIPAYLMTRDLYTGSYLPVSSKEAQAKLTKQYPDNIGNPLAQP